MAVLFSYAMKTHIDKTIACVIGSNKNALTEDDYTERKLSTYTRHKSLLYMEP